MHTVQSTMYIVQCTMYVHTSCKMAVKHRLLLYVLVVYCLSHYVSGKDSRIRKQWHLNSLLRNWCRILPTIWEHFTSKLGSGSIKLLFSTEDWKLTTVRDADYRRAEAPPSPSSRLELALATRTVTNGVEEVNLQHAHHILIYKNL